MDQIQNGDPVAAINVLATVLATSLAAPDMSNAVVWCMVKPHDNV